MKTKTLVATPQSISKRFGKNLTDIMTALDLRATDLSRLTGLTSAQIYTYMNGRSSPSLKVLDKIARVIPVSIDRLTR